MDVADRIPKQLRKAQCHCVHTALSKTTQIEHSSKLDACLPDTTLRRWLVLRGSRRVSRQLQAPFQPWAVSAGFPGSLCQSVGDLTPYEEGAYVIIKS